MEEAEEEDEESLNNHFIRLQCYTATVVPSGPISAFSALSNYGHQFFDSPTPLIGGGGGCQIDATKQQQQPLLFISAGANSLLLLSYNYRNESLSPHSKLP
ncbi:hypothetical protein niasHT_025133 [Heterodera trifolii]|uniref:Uncharacterized protein n=1 Tax=Heterodera trifolii TaxID=157864 RepID=A0ABD2K1D2_9BILA